MTVNPEPTHRPPIPAAEAWLTVAEASKLMRLGRNTVYRLCSDGVLPHRRVGRSLHIQRSVALSWTGDGAVADPTGTLRTVR